MKIRISDQKLISDFREAIMKIDSLKEFWDIHNKAINKEESDFSIKYACGIYIADAFDSVFKEECFTKQKEKIEKIKMGKLPNGLLLKDVIRISFSGENADESSLSKISFALADNYNSKYYNPEKARQKRMMYAEQRKMFSQSVLSNLIIIFESYLAEIYELLVVFNHKQYLENKQMYVSEIFNLELHEIIHNVIRNEVEQNMYDSLKTLDKIKEKSGFDIDRYAKIRKQFEEIYYRRNIYVHNNGIVNEIYLSKVDKRYCSKVEVNQYLSCDDDYLLNAIGLVKKVICSMYYELLNCEICKEQNTFNALSDVGFETLCQKDYSIAEHIYNMLSRHKGFEYIDRAVYQINYINALKQQGRNIEKLLNEFDVSIATDTFKIAKFCLQEKFEDAYKLLLRSYPESFDAISLREWPLFINFRNTEYYKKFKDEHIDDFKKFVFEDNPIVLENEQSTEQPETIAPEEDVCKKELQPV